jgi:hypothetical protein
MNLLPCFKDLPDELIRLILGFIPPPPDNSIKISPSLQRELEKVQKLNLKGCKSTYLRDLEDFVLD